MEFTEREIHLLVTLLEAERKKQSGTLNYFHEETESAYKKLLGILKASGKAYQEENGYHCDRCQTKTPESELDNNGGICNACAQNELNERLV